MLTGSSWGPDQTAEATVYSVNQNDSIFEEVAARPPHVDLTAQHHRDTRSSSRAERRDRVYADRATEWPLRSFTDWMPVAERRTGIKTGDVVKATVVGNVISSYINGAPVLQVTDNTYTGGSPGIGFYLQNAAGVSGDYGFSSFIATAERAPRTLRARRSRPVRGDPRVAFANRSLVGGIDRQRSHCGLSGVSRQYPDRDAAGTIVLRHRSRGREVLYVRGEGDRCGRKCFGTSTSVVATTTRAARYDTARRAHGSVGHGGLAVQMNRVVGCRPPMTSASPDIASIVAARRSES